MTRILAALALVALAACGADGEPVQPTANLGINVGTSGVSTSASVGVSTGPVTVNVGLF